MKISGRKKDDAVSEIIGAVLLISIVVLAGSIIAVAFLSQPQAQKIPAVSALISNQSQMVFIKHVGGDSLPNGTYKILVDGADVTSSITTPSTWSIGNTLTYTKPGTTPPSIVQVVYTGAGSPVVIAVSYFGMLSTVGKGIYMITASAGPGGSISPSGAVPVAYGTNQTFTITNSTGYYIAGVSVDGNSAGAVSTYTLTNVTSSHTIYATFMQNPVITASAGSGGIIAPSGNVSVAYGGNQTFNITPITGYSVVNVLVDGQSQGNATSFTFTNVTASHTIYAGFAVSTFYNITASATAGGQIIPNGTVPVAYGYNQTFTITNFTGYYIAGVSVDGVPQGSVTNYSFINVTATHAIAASFASNPVIAASAGSGGTIAPSGNVSVAYGGSQTFNITPLTGYSISTVLADNSSVGKVTSYTFTNVTANHSIAANFTINTFNITASSTSGGSISPNGTISVTYGSNMTFTISPNPGQIIIAVMVDGVNQGTNSTYTFTNVTAAHTIAASFITNQYTITASAGTGGSITPSGSVIVYSGTNQTFSITPNAGYYIAGVSVDNTPLGMLSSYTFTNVQASHTISATFATNPVITASAGSGGAISPSGAVSVAYGGNQTFAITPNTGYHIAGVSVDNVAQIVGTTYTFTNVTTAHTISATFAINTYTITASSGANGAVTPTGVTTVNYGGSLTYTITPNTGYSVASVVVDGSSLPASTTYTFSNVQTTHTITATFAINTYSITVTQGSNGIISPGTTSVNYGGSQTFTITPNTGYSIASVLVDGSSVRALTSYTFSTVQASHTISATFAINTYTITASSGANGAVTPTGVTNINYGGNQTYTITPNTGYSVASVSVDGSSVGAVSTYTFTNVVASHTIAASFALNAPTITGITPNSGITGTSVSITNLAGTNFIIGGTPPVVQLNMGANTITATSVNVISSTQITCTFSLTGASTGAWNVVVTNSGGQTATLPSGFTVTSNIIPASTISLNSASPKPGYLLSGGYMQFRATGSYYTITHGGIVHTLNNGDIVKLTINSDTQGNIYVTTGQISTFAFNDVDLTINGVDYGRNTISSIYIGSYDSYMSTLTLNVPSQLSWTDLIANGVSIIPGIPDSHQITIYNLGMGSGGINTNSMTPYIYFTGGTTGYTLS